MLVALVAPHGRAVEARATVRSALDADLAPVVLAPCRCYQPLAAERVLSMGEVGIPVRQLRRAAASLLPPQWYRWLLATLLVQVIDAGEPVAAVASGLEVLERPEAAFRLLIETELVVTARTGAVADILSGRPRRARSGPLHEPDLVLVAAGASSVATTWRTLTEDWRIGTDSVDLLAGLHDHRVVRATDLVLSDGTLPSGARVTYEENRLAVDRRPVAFLDLSRADRDTPWLFDATAEEPRVLLSQHRALGDLVHERLGKRRQDGLSLAQPDHMAPFGVTSIGSPIDDPLRHLFRDAPSHAPEEALDPFDEAGAETLRTWLSTVPGGQGAGDVSLYLHAIWQTRPDLQARFPRIPGRDAQALRIWASRHADDEGYDVSLLPAAEPESRPQSRFARFWPHSRLSRVRPRRRGVNVVGYLAGELGIGESARLVTEALKAARVPVETESIALRLSSRQRPDDSAVPGGLAYDVTLLCVNAAELGHVIAAYDLDLPAGHRIGYWYWEVETFPASQHGAFHSLDEVWVATDFVRDAVARHSPVPVVTMTPPLWQEPSRPARGRRQLGLPEGRPVVLFSFDYLSTAERKNPWGAVEAFRRAFQGDRAGDRPMLVIKSINADQRVREAERLRVQVGDDPDIVLLEDYLDPEDRDALTATCDVYLSLHRSEGLGLTIVEAMRLGKPVVATAYGGNMQFMDDTNSYLVPWRPVPIPLGCDPYPPGSTWADPDLDQAAALLRRAVLDLQGSRLVGERAAASLRTGHTAALAGEAMRARLDALRRTDWLRRFRR